MPSHFYEIRICESCGLRYPLLEGHTFGMRCPACMGITRVVFSRPLFNEPDADPQREPPKYVGPALTKVDNQEERHENLTVLLDNIRSAWNVGSILRSADGFGFTHAYLCGITPTAENEGVTKTSLGAENSVPWSYHTDAVKLVKGLKKEGWKVYALEENGQAMDISHAAGVTRQFGHEVLIVGNEVTGVDPELLDLCDKIFYIPMQGEKKSFNVAIAFGIAAYVLTIRQLKS
jgi:23S rRNA (guanosine2251-2'-O)-methyltransferase